MKLPVFSVYTLYSLLPVQMYVVGINEQKWIYLMPHVNDL